MFFSKYFIKKSTETQFINIQNDWKWMGRFSLHVQYDSYILLYTDAFPRLMKVQESISSVDIIFLFPRSEYIWIVNHSKEEFDWFQ